MKINRFTVRKITQEMTDVRTYTFGYGPYPFEFEPGQFAIVHLNNDIQGPLTFSSSPTDKGQFEMTVKRTGNFGTRFYDTIRAGDPVPIATPMGKFILEREKAYPVCFIGRDYAITAARSFHRFLVATPPVRQFTLLHEISGFDQVLYDAEFRNHPVFEGFTRILTLDQPTRSGGWTGPLGRVTPRMFQGLYEESPDIRFYAAGEGIDIAFYKNQLQTAGIPKSNVLVERWS